MISDFCLTDEQKRQRKVFVNKELKRIKKEKKNNENKLKKHWTKIFFSDEVRISWSNDQKVVLIKFFLMN